MKKIKHLIVSSISNLINIVNINEFIFFSLYMFLTFMSIIQTFLLFMQYMTTMCEQDEEKVLDFPIYLMAGLNMCMKALSIAFVRYDCVSKRLDNRGITVWRPFFISFLLVGTCPAIVAPLFVFNFEACYTRSPFISFIVARIG